MARTTSADHGDRRRYQCGCRCRACTEANTVYQRRYRSGLTAVHRYTVAGVRVEQPPLPYR